MPGPFVLSTYCVAGIIPNSDEFDMQPAPDRVGGARECCNRHRIIIRVEQTVEL